MSSTFGKLVSGLNAQRRDLFEEITEVTEEIIQLYSDEGINYDPVAELQEEINTLLKKIGAFQPTEEYYESSESEFSESDD